MNILLKNKRLLLAVDASVRIDIQRIVTYYRSQGSFVEIKANATTADIKHHFVIVGGQGALEMEQYCLENGIMVHSIDGHKDFELPPEREHGLYLIGSGPGDPRLLTTEASELIKTLPVIITDKLISPQILEMIPSTTKIYYANKTCGKQIQGQTDIDKWILQHLASGESVGRLKSGDPFIFGRGGEEWLLSTSHGFKCFYIAGISSSLSCGQVLIPPTHRGIANQVLICTGKTREEVPSHMVPYHPERTLILLMAMGNLSVVVERLFSLGYPESLPCCLIEKITWEDQRSFKCDLRDLLKTREINQVKNHATLVIGHVVNVLEDKEDIQSLISNETLI